MSTGATTISVLGLSIGLVALLVLCDVVFPSVIARACHNVEHLPVRSFAVGLINFGFFGLLSVALLSGERGAKLLGLIVGTLLLSFVAAGLAAVARLIGTRLRPHDGPLRQVMLGAITLELAALVPFVGWFVVPLLAGLVGYGATIIALIWRGQASQEPRATGQEPETGR